jgi:hypothetical protein
MNKQETQEFIVNFIVEALGREIDEQDVEPELTIHDAAEAGGDTIQLVTSAGIFYVIVRSA